MQAKPRQDFLACKPRQALVWQAKLFQAQKTRIAMQALKKALLASFLQAGLRLVRSLFKSAPIQNPSCSCKLFQNTISDSSVVWQETSSPWQESILIAACDNSTVLFKLAM